MISNLVYYQGNVEDGYAFFTKFGGMALIRSRKALPEYVSNCDVGKALESGKRIPHDGWESLAQAGLVSRHKNRYKREWVTIFLKRG